MSTAAMSSLAPSQPYGDILRLVRLVQAPVTGAAAVKQMVRGVYEVVTSKRIMEVVQQPRSSSSEAQVASCVAAVLQCAGWLVAARQAAVLGQPQFLNSLGQCVFCCTAFLDLLPEGRPDLLGAALQVSWGEHVPGFTTWFPVAAQELLDAPAASERPLPSSRSAAAAVAAARYVMEEALVALWVRCFTTWSCLRVTGSFSGSSSRGGGAPGAWQSPSLLQLADKLLQRPLVSMTPIQVFVAICKAASPPLISPLVHPRLAAAARRTPDPALAAQVASAVQQECWWRALATNLTASTDTVAAAAASTPQAAHLPQHPSKACPAYHKQHAYGGQAAEGWPLGLQINWLPKLFNVLLVAQLWEVWPWQLEQLQAAAAHNEDGRASVDAGAASAASAASSSGAARDSGKRSTQHSKYATNSSGSSKALAARWRAPPSLLGSKRLPAHHMAWDMVLRATGLDWPLLPKQYVGDAHPADRSPPPVTLQQPQLAVSALARSNAAGAVSAALLLALLLQRADPGLRASFLGGPGGTALLAAAQYWGYTAVLDSAAREIGQPFGVYDAVSWVQSAGAARMLAALNCDLPVEQAGWEPAAPSGSLGLLLAWCYLVPVENWEVEVPGGWGRCPRHPCLVTTLHHARPYAEKVSTHPECLVVETVPGEALSFAPGVTPTPLLLGTLEAVLRADKGTCGLRLLHSVAAFVHATVVWLGDASGGSSGSAAPEADEAGSKGRSSASKGSSSSQHNGTGSSCSNPASNKCAAGTADLLVSLASLGVTLGGLATSWGGALRKYTSNTQRLHTMAQDVAPPCCLVAAKLLHLAAQQLAVPGQPALPALQLAAAAQRLAGACAELAEIVGTALVQVGDEVAMTGMLYGMKPALCLMSSAVQALQAAKPCWQTKPQVSSTRVQPGHKQPRALAQRAGLEASGGGGSSSSSSSSCCGYAGLLQVAQGIQRTCHPRLQLVGCSHPHCTNLSGPSAEGLVAGRQGVRCGGCRVARYCSSACQKEDWPQHRHVCRRLTAAATAGPVPRAAG